MPQLSQLELVYLSQWFWLLLVLGAIYFLVGKGIVPKVEETVDQRDAKIAEDLAEAERMQDEAEASEEAWRAKVNDARADAQAVTAAAREKAQADLDAKLAKADAEIAVKAEKAEADLGAALRSAKAEVESVAVEAAQQIVAKLTGANVSEAEARKAVAKELADA